MNSATKTTTSDVESISANLSDAQRTALAAMWDAGPKATAKVNGNAAAKLHAMGLCTAPRYVDRRDMHSGLTQLGSVVVVYAGIR